MSSRIFPILVNELCNHRLIYWFLSFFAIPPPPLWDSRRRIWKIADNALNLLDLGCGYAHITRSSKARNVLGIDLDRNALKEANRHGKSNFYPVLCAATNLPFMDKTFDVIIATEIIEHIQNSEQCIKEAHRVLRNKGVLLISTPNGDCLPLLPKDHVRHYKQQALIWLLSPFFQIRKMEKRFGASFTLACRLTSLRPLKRQRSRSNRERENSSRSGSLKFFVLAGPLLIAMSPIVNILQIIEDKTRNGKYNFVVECIKL